MIAYIEDTALTDHQKELKWSLYCEMDLETLEDIEAVLNSLLKDVRDIYREVPMQRNG